MLNKTGECARERCTSSKLRWPRLVLVTLLLASVSVAAEEQTADRVTVEKAKKIMTLYHQGEKIRTYKIALGGLPEGPKERQGDRKTPEGIYKIDSRNSNSQFHRSLRVSYPNENDRKRAKKLGVNPGGEIMIHGLPNGRGWLGSKHRLYDWTNGCIAVTDEEIEEIWKLVPIGTTVEIKP
jgi:murein L,D-transpeptidase YafK